MKAVEFKWPRILYDHFQLPDWHVEIKLGKRAARADSAWEILKDYLPDKVDTLLDIGSGLAMLDPLIVNARGTKKVYLIDGDGTAEQRAGFKDTAEAWSNVSYGQAVVVANVPKNVPVLGMFPTGADAIPDKSIDLIVSFRAWGHHFSIESYIPLVKRVLADGGHIITDIRNKTNGRELLQHAGFEAVKQIPDHSTKCTRWVYKRRS